MNALPYHEAAYRQAMNYQGWHNPYGGFPQQDYWYTSQMMLSPQSGFPPQAGTMWPAGQVFPPTQQAKPGSHFLFQNPLEPAGPKSVYPGHMNQMLPMNGIPPFNPYPKGQFVQKPPGAMQSILGSFKGQDGTIDINKMVNTAGQMINTVSQASALIKGLGGVFKA